MNKTLTLKLLLIYCWISMPYYSQHFSFRGYGLEQGLPQSQVTCLAEDPSGRLWLGTKSGGVSVFNGHDFKNYSTKDGLPSNNILSVVVDSKGAVWIGSDKGLVYFDGKSRFSKVEELSLGKFNITDQLLLPDGSLIIGTNLGGIFLLKDSLIGLEGTRDYGRVESFCVLNDVVYAGFNTGRVISIKNSRVLNDGFSVKGTINELSVINGQLCASTTKGIHFVQGDTLKWLRNIPDLQDENVTAFYADAKGRTWITTYGRGVYMWDKELSHFWDENSSVDNFINNVFEDQDGNMWLGSDGAGVFKFLENDFLHYTKADGLQTAIVTCFEKGLYGILWIGTENGLHLIDHNGKVRIFNEYGLGSKKIHKIFRDTDDFIWVCTNDGVHIIDGETVLRLDDPLLNTLNVLDMVQLSFDKFWLGTHDGIVEVNRDNDEILANFVPNSEKVIGANCFFKTDKELWIGGGNGLFLANENHIAMVNGEIDEITAITSDVADNLWVVSHLHCVKVNKKDYSVIPSTSLGQLEHTFVYSILSNDNEMWLGTHQGVLKAVLNLRGEIEFIEKYQKSDGFELTECYLNAVFMDVTEVWFGTLRGATRVNLYSNQFDRTLPVVDITGMEVLRMPVDSLYKYLSLNDMLFKFKHDQNYLTFNFSGNELSKSDKVYYRYRIQNFEKDWSPVSTIGSILYQNLPSGNFIFEVQASNDRVNWSKSAMLNFVIATPFWRSWWFKMLCILAAVGLFGFMVYQRMQRQQRYRFRLEQMIKERTAELSSKNKELEMLSIVASKMNEALLIADSNGSVLYLNNAFIRNYGYLSIEDFTRDYGVDVKLQDLSNHPDIEGVIKNFNLDQSVVIYDSAIELPNGNQIWTNSSLQPIYRVNGELDKIAEVFTDITARKRLEQSLTKQNKDITDSIRYAKRIQQALLSLDSKINSFFSDAFVFNQPRDIVSGDFYYIEEVGEKIVICVADCTGHGVPGAFMSVIGNQFLKEITSNPKITSPSDALFILDKKINIALHQTKESHSSKDGMDIAMLWVYKEKRKALFSGAFNPLYRIRDKSFEVFESASESIGGYKEESKGYYSHEIDLLPDDVYYMFSDGFQDQFGGQKYKKFSRSRFQQLLISLHELPMENQRHYIEEAFLEWKGDKRQIDDVFVLGVKV